MTKPIDALTVGKTNRFLIDNENPEGGVDFGVPTTKKRLEIFLSELPEGEVELVKGTIEKLTLWRLESAA